MARTGKTDKAQRQARRLRRQRMQEVSPPQSSPRRRPTPAPPRLPREEVTAVRERPLPLAAAGDDVALEDAFFANQAARLEPLELDEEDRENPVLSPAQQQRRLQLRRRVAALMAGLSLLALLALWLHFGG